MFDSYDTWHQIDDIEVHPGGLVLHSFDGVGWVLWTQLCGAPRVTAEGEYGSLELFWRVNPWTRQMLGAGDVSGSRGYWPPDEGDCSLARVQAMADHITAVWTAYARGWVSRGE